MTQPARYVAASPPNRTRVANMGGGGFEMLDGPGEEDDPLTVFIYDRGQVVWQFDALVDEGFGLISGNDLSHRYLWGPGVDQLLTDEQVVSLEAEGEVLWAMADHLGSVRDVIDSNADLRIHRQFDTFGNIVDAVHYDEEGEIVVSGPGYVTVAFAFTGRWRDEVTGQQHNLFRWYDPATGGWISEDPLPLPLSDENPYRYVDNMPAMYADPRGLLAEGGFNNVQGRQVDDDLERFRELQQAAQQGRPLPPGYTTWTNSETGYVHVVPPSGAGVHKPSAYNGPNLYGYYLTHPGEMDSDLQTAQVVALGVAAGALGAAVLLDVAFVYGISQVGYVSLQAVPHVAAYELATWGGAGAVAAAGGTGSGGAATTGPVSSIPITGIGGQNVGAISRPPFDWIRPPGFGGGPPLPLPRPPFPPPAPPGFWRPPIGPIIGNN